MSMDITLKGQTLTQQQLDAIVPVLNERMNKRMSLEKFEAACVSAMEKAGCPLPKEVSSSLDIHDSDDNSQGPR